MFTANHFYKTKVLCAKSIIAAFAGEDHFKGSGQELSTWPGDLGATTLPPFSTFAGTMKNIHAFEQSHEIRIYLLFYDENS